MNSAQTLSIQEFDTLPVAWSWRGVLRAAAVCQLILLLATMVALHDLLSAALAIILLGGLTLFLLRGKMFGFIFQMVARVVMWRIPEERLGALILGFLFADIGLYTVTGTATNLWHGASGTAILLPAALGAFSAIGFVAAAFCVLKPSASIVPNRAAVNFVVGVLIVLSVVLGIGLLRGTASAARALPSGAVKLVVENMAYSKNTLTADAGDVAVALENHDLFWHTFTIDQLGVDIKVPMQATDQIRFQAPPGVYSFHCTIPGHEMLGMHGTLTVK